MKIIEFSRVDGRLIREQFVCEGFNKKNGLLLCELLNDKAGDGVCYQVMDLDYELGSSMTYVRKK